MKKILFTLAFMTTLAVAIFVLCSCNKTETIENSDTCKVTYVKNGEIVHVSYAERNTAAVEFLPETSDYAFVEWHLNGVPYNFSSPVKEDIVLTAVYSRSFNITFVADKVTVKTCEYTYYDKEISLPVIPQKKGYSGKWQSFSLSGGDITVNAEYSPIYYSVTYYDGNTVLTKQTRYIGDNFQSPKVPYQPGYKGDWEYTLEKDSLNVKANAVYSLAPFTALFTDGDEIIKTCETDVENYPSVYPEIPEKEHFYGAWEESIIDYEACTITVNAYYSPVIYHVTFKTENFSQSFAYTVIDNSINPPHVPEISHYNGEWNDYTLSGGDVTVTAKYTPIEYSIEFYVDGKLYKTLYYTIEDSIVTPPEIPAKTGYTAEWSEFTVDFTDMRVDAVYTLLHEETAGLIYENRNGELFVTGYEGSDSDVYIPSFHDGLPVKGIDDVVFSCSDLLESVNIYEGIESIGDNAFVDCPNLASVSLPDGIKTIGSHAFLRCISLKSIKLPKGLISISEQCFFASGLEKIEIPDTVEEISEYAFCNCENLKKVTVSDRVIKICSRAFYMCSSLTHIYFGKSLKYIEAFAFLKCDNLEYAEFSAPEGWVIKTSSAPTIDLSERYFRSPADAAAALVALTDKTMIKENKD